MGLTGLNQGVVKGFVSSGDSWGPFYFLLQVLKAAHIPWLVASSSIVKVSRIIQDNLLIFF